VTVYRTITTEPTEATATGDKYSKTLDWNRSDAAFASVSQQRDVLGGVLGSLLGLALLLNAFLFFVLLKRRRQPRKRPWPPLPVIKRSMTADSDASSINPRSPSAMEHADPFATVMAGPSTRPVSQIQYLERPRSNSVGLLVPLSRTGTAETGPTPARALYTTNPS
jgi:hypothetical protein